MKTKIVFSGDWQLEVSNLDRAQIVVDQICENLGPNSYFVHLGDIKESTNPVDQRVINFIVKAWEQIRSCCGGTAFVRGNHDSITTQDGVPSIVTLISALGVEYVAGDDWDIATFGGGVNVFLVPYFRDPARQLKAFQDASAQAKRYRKSCNVLAFHNETKGCERTAYVKGEGLTRDDLAVDTYNLCVSGHIHRPHQSGEVYFAGSPFCMDWGECNEDKSLFVAHFDNKDVRVERIPSKIPGWYDPKVPGYIKPASFKGSHVRITVPINTDPVKEMSEARAHLEKRYPDAILHLIPDLQGTNPPDKVDLSGGDSAVLRRYLERLTLPEYVNVGQIINYLEEFLPELGTLGVQGLHFKSLEAQNCLSFKQCKMDLDVKGLTLITGQNLDWGVNISNGSGKSSLVSLPFLALFGRTFKDQVDDGWARQKTQAPAIINSTFGLPDGRELRILRKRRPGVLQVFVDGVEQTMGDKHATQRYIEQLTNLTWDVLTNAVYIGQREIGSVFGTDKERKELFSQLLGLSRFLKVNAALRKIRTKRELAVAFCDSEVHTTEAAMDEAQSGTVEIQEALKTTPVVDPKDLKGKEREIQELEALLRQLNKDNETLQMELDANQKVFEKHLFAAADAEGRIQGLQEQINKSASVEGQCALCGGKVSVAVLEKYLQDLKSKIATWELVCEKEEGAQESNRSIRRALTDKFHKNTAAYQAARFKINKLNQELSSLQDQQAARQRLESLLALKKKRIKELNKRLEVHQLARTFCMEEVKFIDICIDVTGRDGLPAFLCEVSAPQLNLAAARYSEFFTGGEIGIQFQLSQGDIDLNVCNLNGGLNIKDQSAGELRMASLIVALAFRDVLVKHNILVLDEPSEGLDGTNATAFARGLNAVIERFQHVMVISHSSHILASLEPDRHIEVVKENGISTAKDI